MAEHNPAMFAAAAEIELRNRIRERFHSMDIVAFVCLAISDQNIFRRLAWEDIFLLRERLDKADREPTPEEAALCAPVIAEWRRKRAAEASSG